jgi:hypothetical protein
MIVNDRGDYVPYLRRPSKRYPYSSERQGHRYSRNNMIEQQHNSHKPGTVQPRHIFGVEESEK